MGARFLRRRAPIAFIPSRRSRMRSGTRRPRTADRVDIARRRRDVHRGATSAHRADAVQKPYPPAGVDHEAEVPPTSDSWQRGFRNHCELSSDLDTSEAVSPRRRASQAHRRVDSACRCSQCTRSPAPTRRSPTTATPSTSASPVTTMSARRARRGHVREPGGAVHGGCSREPVREPVGFAARAATGDEDDQPSSSPSSDAENGATESAPRNASPSRR